MYRFTLRKRGGGRGDGGREEGVGRVGGREEGWERGREGEGGREGGIGIRSLQLGDIPLAFGLCI